MATWTHATNGTATTETMTWTTGTSTTDTWVMHEPLAPPRTASPKPPLRRDPFIKKDFWHGVEWKLYTSYVPRKSITGKWIIGPMYKRWRTPAPMDRGKGLGTFKQFAGKKELFEEKLRGNA